MAMTIGADERDEQHARRDLERHGPAAEERVADRRERHDGERLGVARPLGLAEHGDEGAEQRERGDGGRVASGRRTARSRRCR